MNAPLEELYRIEPLASYHDRSAFSCGVEVLDRYLRTQAGQDARRHVTSPYVAVHISTGAIAGYFTLSSAGATFTQLPIALAKSLPKYPVLPVTLLGRLAVDTRHRGVGLGEHLLLAALDRCLESSRLVAAFAVVVDAKDESAVAFYSKYGFIPFPETPSRLLLPMVTIDRFFHEA